MKRISIAALSLALTMCMLGGCAAKSEQPNVIFVSSGGVSGSSSTGQASGFSEVQSSSSASSSTKVPVSVVIPTESTYSSSQSSSTDVTSSFSSSVTSSSSSSVTSSSSSSVTSSVSQSKPIVSSSSSSSSSTSSSSSSSVPVSSSSITPFVPPNDPVGTNPYKALNYSEVKGIWISYIELGGLSSGSESAFRSSISRVYDNCVSLGVNTVFVHVRSHSDAYYESAYFPRTKYLGGSYDPLPIMIEEAHKRGLSFQAWINPLRGCSVNDIKRENGYPLYDWAGGETRLVEVNNYYYLNPAYPEVVDLIAKGAEEIVAKYDVDGLHIDDYFYPTTETWFDAAAYQESSYTSLSDFRFANCDKLVSALYGAVKKANSSALFGVSPQGNYNNNYVYMYADVEKWCTQSGYLDYIMPQIYFGFKNAAQPYSDVVKQWNGIAAKGKVPLIVGLAPSKIGTEDYWGGTYGKREWIDDKEILKRQFLEAAEQVSYGGICLYSYNSMFNADSDVKPQVDAEVAALKSVLA